MPDPFGITEGAKTLAGSLDSAREGSKQLTKSIEGIQHDGLDVASKGPVSANVPTERRSSRNKTHSSRR